MTPTGQSPTVAAGRPLDLFLRVATLSVVAAALVFPVSNVLIFWGGWPGLDGLFAHIGWFGFEPLRTPLAAGEVARGTGQVLFYVAPVAAITVHALMTRQRSLRADAELLSGLSAYIARAAFWSVLLVGLADMVISFLRVEGLLTSVVGQDLAQQLGRSSFRGNYVHYPLVALSMVIAAFSRSLGFTWLALLIVLAEFQIVIARFIFSYEQAFMGDLVRFWYAALFLFASAYTLLHEGHVRVDILYAGFTERGKAWTNALGSVLLGIPLCWIVLMVGMWGKSNLINAPLLSYEVTQSGYGMYVKYLMAGFLLVYALSMLVQFASTFLSSAAVLLREAPPEDSHEHAQ